MVQDDRAARAMNSPLGDEEEAEIEVKAGVIEMATGQEGMEFSLQIGVWERLQ